MGIHARQCPRYATIVDSETISEGNAQTLRWDNTEILPPRKERDIAKSGGKRSVKLTGTKPRRITNIYGGREREATPRSDCDHSRDRPSYDRLLRYRTNHIRHNTYCGDKERETTGRGPRE